MTSRGVVAGLLLVGSLLLGGPAAGVADPTDSSAATTDSAGLGGEPLAGSTDQAAPTPVELGTWTDTLTREGRQTSKWYRYTRSDRSNDSTVIVGVATAGPDPEGELTLEVLDSGGDSCGEEDVGRFNAGSQPLGATVIAGRDDFADREATCLTSEYVDIGVRTEDGELPIDFTLRVIEENPYVPDATDESESRLPQPLDGSDPLPRIAVTPGGGTSSGGHSLEAAPSLPEGSFSTTVPVGGYAVWKVPLTWGEELRAGALVEAEKEYEDLYGVYVSLSVLTPALGDVPAPYAGASSYEAALSAEDPLELTTATGEVRLLNRYGSYGSSLVGDYYLLVSVSDAYTPGSYPDIPISISGEVIGTETGTPDFDGAPAYVEGSDAVSEPEQAKQDPPAGDLRRNLLAAALAALGVASLLWGTHLLRRR